MSKDRVREIEDKIADLQTRLESLKDELEKAREAGKIDGIKAYSGKTGKGGISDRGNY
jgi:chromosome segregation ATPase